MNNLGNAADSSAHFAHIFGIDLLSKFEIYSYRNAATILKNGFPEHFSELVKVLKNFEISKQMIRLPGGSKSVIAAYVDGLFPPSMGWQEARISADLFVRVAAAKGQEIYREYTKEGYLDGHRIDFLKGRVALDLEWNSKDQTYDRDLFAFSAFYDAGAIDLGILITRGNSLDNEYFRSLGKVLKKDGTIGTEEVYKKFGASTTWMGKLLYRLDAGRNGGCPVLAIGITPQCVTS